MRSNPWFWRALAFFWLVKIFWFSTETFAGSETGRFLSGILAALGVSWTRESFQAAHALLRKCAHLFEYGLLSLLLYRALGAPAFARWRPGIAALAVALAAAYSITDEFHQVFVRGRSGSPADCMLDTAGAALGMLMVYGYWQLRDGKTRPAELAGKR